MKTFRTSANIRRLVLAATIAAVFLWGGRKVAAFNPQPDPPAFGLIAIDPNETMRLNATCPNVTLNGVPPTPCAVTLGFADSHGSLIKQSSYTLNPGDSTSLDLSASEVTFEPNRAEIQASFTATQGLAVPSVEVFDVASGRTDVYVSPVPRLGLIER
jgi:hypothetical protein